MKNSLLLCFALLFIALSFAKLTKKGPCQINENKNRRGANRCSTNSDCQGVRTCNRWGPAREIQAANHSWKQSAESMKTKIN